MSLAKFARALSSPRPAAGDVQIVLQDGFPRLRDANGRIYRLRPEPGSPDYAVAASVLVDPAGADNNFTVTAKRAGIAANGAPVVLTVSGSGSTVTAGAVTPANQTNPAGIALTIGSATTAQTVINYINSTPAISELFEAAASGTVTGTIGTLTTALLAGGVDAYPLASAGDQLYDEDQLYTATKDIHPWSVDGWLYNAGA
jgi:hypothetical protein